MKKLFTLLFLSLACAGYGFTPETGDLLFQIGAGSGMERAIMSAPAGRSDLPFTHVGVAERTEDGIWVWKASPRGGVKHTPLNAFFADAEVPQGVLGTNPEDLFKSPLLKSVYRYFD